MHTTFCILELRFDPRPWSIVSRAMIPTLHGLYRPPEDTTLDQEWANLTFHGPPKGERLEQEGGGPAKPCIPFVGLMVKLRAGRCRRHSNLPHVCRPPKSNLTAKRSNKEPWHTCCGSAKGHPNLGRGQNLEQEGAGAIQPCTPFLTPFLGHHSDIAHLLWATQW